MLNWRGSQGFAAQRKTPSVAAEGVDRDEQGETSLQNQVWVDEVQSNASQRWIASGGLYVGKLDHREIMSTYLPITSLHDDLAGINAHLQYATTKVLPALRNVVVSTILLAVAVSSLIDEIKVLINSL